MLNLKNKIKQFFLKKIKNQAHRYRKEICGAKRKGIEEWGNW